MRILEKLSLVCLICITLTACNQPPEITTDGNWIAYTSEHHVFVISANGGEPVRLTPKSFDKSPTKWPCWSPDGTRLAFLAGWDVFTIHSDGTELTNLTHSQERDEEFSWSLNGSTIAVKEVVPLRLIDLDNPGNARELDMTSGSEEYFPTQG